MIQYNQQPVARVKRFIKTVTRTFDENESMIEERVEEDTEYEYVQTYHPQSWNSGQTYLSPAQLAGGARQV